jgi:hypothetical protein
MKFVFFALSIYFILSVSAQLQETFTGNHKGGEMTSQSGIFCLTYTGNAPITKVTLREGLSGGLADPKYETINFVNDGQPHKECWPHHDSLNKNFHFDYDTVCSVSASVSVTT